MCEKLVDDIQPVTETLGLVLFILNIFLPGFGTMLNACLGPKFSCTQLGLGFVQGILTFFLIGWLWSIYWGYLIYKKAKTGDSGFSKM